MENRVKFSIIVPVYNLEKEIKKTVLGLLSQQGTTEYEIILIDDGSTDGSALVCDELKESYQDKIKTVHQENKGPGAARNAGIEIAEGEYIIFVDGDDTLKSNALETLSTTLDKYNSDIIGYQIENQNKKVITRGIGNAKPFSLEENKAYLLELPSLCNRAWKKALFTDNNISISEEYFVGEDLCVVAKLLACAKSIVVIPDVLYCYNQHEGSLIGDGGRSNNMQLLAVFDEVIGWYKENNLFDKYYDELCQLCVEHLLLASSVREIKTGRFELVPMFRDYTDKTFSGYMHNHYISSMSFARLLALTLVRLKAYGLVKLLFQIKDRK